MTVRCKCGQPLANEQDYQAHMAGIRTIDDGKEHGKIGEFGEDDDL